MKKQLCTLFCAALLSLPSSSHLLASAPAKKALPPTARLKSTTNVDLEIYIPYEGKDDYWDITFVNNATGDSYFFETNSSMQISHTLGTIPAGFYDITFHAKSPFHTRFEYYTECTDDGVHLGYGDYTLTNRELAGGGCNDITIDAWQ